VSTIDLAHHLPFFQGGQKVSHIVEHGNTSLICHAELLANDYSRQ